MKLTLTVVYKFTLLHNRVCCMYFFQLLCLVYYTSCSLLLALRLLASLVRYKITLRSQDRCEGVCPLSYQHPVKLRSDCLHTCLSNSSPILQTIDFNVAVVVKIRSVAASFIIVFSTV